jgi:hypothetical protein
VATVYGSNSIADSTPTLERRLHEGLGMSKHIAQATEEQRAELVDIISDWCKEQGFSGSIADQYSLYRAVEDEFDRADAAYRREKAKQRAQ